MRFDFSVHSCNGGNLERLSEDLKITGKPASSAWFCQANNSHVASQQAG